MKAAFSQLNGHSQASGHSFDIQNLILAATDFEAAAQAWEDDAKSADELAAGLARTEIARLRTMAAETRLMIAAKLAA